ncbi:hypothetical protein CTRI78_v012266 [Colletotrichum trifolii]|uniref:PAS domain-containing protein n=1 Tax=Colletotrichum trifolii TaxID=5466 RepID=A0A4R8PXS8_COLTR|nr:hypothetical protein CTRI78_v012266 [Colletotrichum trifolii]
MEQTFMTIHSTEPDAAILFVSDSVYDILGYTPQEVQGRSCFEFFHPEEVPFARSIHNRGVLLDKAAVLHYVRIQSRDGQWVSWRAMEAPQIRRIFSSSPRDPRYHMLEHLSPKFKMPPVEREPRAALILNRFTRTLTVMFATNAVSSILGVRPDQIKDKSFYECIQENCLPDAIRCLESAKANDSIAYLRFWYRDPRRAEDFEYEEEDGEHHSGNSSDSEGGGVQLDGRMEIDEDHPRSPQIKQEDGSRAHLSDHSSSSHTTSTNNSGSSSRTHPITDTTAPSLDGAANAERTTPAPSRSRGRESLPAFELEAVVSCTSDGLVVVIRKARPPIPAPHPPLVSPTYTNGLFAAPWGHYPIRSHVPQDGLYNSRPQYMPLNDNVMAIGGPPVDHLMNSIRDVAVFAWALVGINGNLATYTRGHPRGEAQPDGLPVWDPGASVSYTGPENQAVRRWAAYDEKQKTGFNSTSTYQQLHPHPHDPSPRYGPSLRNSPRDYPYPQTPTWPWLQPAYTSGYDQYPRNNVSQPPQHLGHYDNHQPQSQYHQSQPLGRQMGLQSQTWAGTGAPYNGQGNQCDEASTTSKGPTEPSPGHRRPWQ